MKFIKKVPEVEGWYWVRYHSPRCGLVDRPARLNFVDDARVLDIFQAGVYISGPSHGGNKFRNGGNPIQDLQFGDRIEEP